MRLARKRGHLARNEWMGPRLMGAATPPTVPRLLLGRLHIPRASPRPGSLRRPLSRFEGCKRRARGRGRANPLGMLRRAPAGSSSYFPSNSASSGRRSASYFVPSNSVCSGVLVVIMLPVKLGVLRRAWCHTFRQTRQCAFRQTWRARRASPPSTSACSVGLGITLYIMRSVPACRSSAWRRLSRVGCLRTPLLQA